MINKALRSLLPIYAIRVSTIQELRYNLGNNLTLGGVIGRLTAFKMSNFDNFTPSIIEYAFISLLVLSNKGKGKCVKNESDVSNDELDELEALMGR